ncbi:Thioesterase-like superfamily protein [Frankineae bacterium MT45]|nr:Thioesterase-like superfamily protein [Frankineae bacterium MT45]
MVPRLFSLVSAISLSTISPSTISPSPITPGSIPPGSTTSRFEADVDGDWTIGGKPNGGYLLTMMGRAAATVGQHPHVIAASAHYLRSPDPGPVTLDAEVLRGGRSASQVRVRMLQEGRPCVEALITTSTLDPDTKPHWDAGVPPRPTLEPGDCLRNPSTSPIGLQVPIMDQVDLRIEPETFGFVSQRPAGLGELRGWLALPADEPFDPAALLYAVDAFPPATFDIEMTGWVPTLELTVYIRALPAPGPVQVLQRAQLIDAQRVDEVCYVWDSTGRLVAHGTQLAGIRLG